MKNSKTAFFFALTLGFLVFPMIPVSANYTANTNIVSAWYADLDSDGLEDDIGVSLTLTISNNRVVSLVDVYIGLELPSGIEFWFLFEFRVSKSTQTASFDLTFHLMDTALESGWYWAYSVAFANNEQYSLMDSYYFDPPGSGSGDQHIL